MHRYSNSRFTPTVFGGGLAAVLLLAGCSHNDPPVMMAPPTTPVTISQPGGQGMDGQMTGQNNAVYNWTDVPVGQQVPITRAVFDQGGYQLYSQEGTIVVPFANQNMYVMKFGQSTTGGLYFLNNGSVPTLFIPPGTALDNAAQPGARWYPFPQNYAYNGPVYVGLAPSWSAFTGMGWYPGMSYYGGYWGNSPYSLVGPMIGLHFLIGGSPYYGWNSYHSYYNSHPYGYAPMRVVNRTVYNQARTSFNSGSGSFGRRTFGSAGTAYGSRSTGSFGRSPSSFGGSSQPRSTGSFGRGPSGFGGSFGAGRRIFPSSLPSSTPSAPSGGSFGSRPSFGSGGSFGGGSSSPRPSFGSGGSSSPRPSFGSGGSSSPRPSFGSGGSSSPRPSFGGGSFGGFGGGGHSSFGGGSFGGGRSSFGGGRRR